jgi:hypothetical protein
MYTVERSKIVDVGLLSCNGSLYTAVSFLKYAGSLRDTVYQDPLYNKCLHINCSNFLLVSTVYVGCWVGFVQYYFM